MRYLKILLVILFLELGCQVSNAYDYDFKVNGLCYIKNNDGTSVIVVRQNNSSPSYSNLIGDLVIPSRVYYANKYYNVTGIGTAAFRGCAELTSVTIPTSVTGISQEAFKGCNGLASLTIPTSVSTIGFSAFSGCGGLTSIVVNDGNLIFDSRDDCNAIIHTESNTLIAGCKNTIIPNSVTSITDRAFDGCTGLTTISIPNSVTSIGNSTFANCSGLISIEIPNSITEINQDAFYGCTSLSEITIPNTVTTIGLDAFRNCSSLKNIYCFIMNPRTVSLGSGIFEGVNKSNCTLTVPYSSMGLYQNYGQWSGFIYIPFANSISLNKNQLNIGCGLNDRLIANILPYNASNTVSWESSNINVASVNQNGVVTALSQGKTIITATTTDKSNLSASCEVNVFVPVNSISLDQTFVSINKGGTLTLSATILPENASKTLLWTSSNTNIATVDQNGKVAAKSVGTATITATTTDGTNLSASCVVTVTQPVTSISLNQSSATIFKNNTLNLVATVLPTNATNKSLSWKSSKTSVATVDQNGKITAKSVGSATITATTTDGTNLSASCMVSVVQPVTSISLSQTSARIYQSGTLTLIATTLPNNAYNNTVNWSSGNSNVATVDQNGKITAKSVGSATITATTTDGTNLSASCIVTVDGITNIEISKTSVNLLIGNTEYLVATVMPSDVLNKTLTWKSSKTTVATVDQNGKVTAKNVGTATITATTTDGTNLSATCTVHVYNKATSVNLNTTQMTLNVGEKENLTATIYPSNTLTEQFPIQWSSSNNIVATVDASGKVTAKSNGTATITASTTDGSNLSATCQVTVRTLATSITLNHSQLIMYKNDSDVLTAIILPETTSNKNVTWSSSNSSIVSVDNAGNINAKATGIATITATTTDGTSLSASCQVQVCNRVSSVSLNYTSLLIEKGYSKQITATVSPSNAYNKKLLWSSSNPSVAIVDSLGVVTAKNVGNTVISATTTDGSNITATCDVEVRAYANEVNLNKHEMSIFAGGTEQLTVQVLPVDSYNTTVTWRTTNSYVATVSSNGLVTANKVGSAKIIATCNGISDTCSVIVKGITSLSLDKHELTLDIESRESLTVQILPNNAINKNLSWWSTNTSVATVSAAGVVTPRDIGTTRIIVQAADGSNVSDTCHVTVIPAYDLYPTTTELTHVRGQDSTSVVIPLWMSNKSTVSGLQFDIILPAGVLFETFDNHPDVWLDATRKARNHSVDVNLISGSKYRVLVSSPTNQTFKGNEGVVMYMRINIDKVHPVGEYNINISNVIFVEPNESQHTGYNKSLKIKYKYLLGDADADARVDIADYTVTALYILNRPVETFYSDAANVNGDNQITITDLVGITNIALGIRPHEYRPAPAITMDDEAFDLAPSLNASMEGDNIVVLSIDNDIPLAGLQFDLQLPQGVILVDALLEGRADEYQLGINTLADGNVRLLLSSFSDKDIETGNDAIIKLVLEGNNNNGDMLYITKAQVAFRDLKSYALNDVSLPMETTSIEGIEYSPEKLKIYGSGNVIVVDSPSSMLIQVVHVNGMVMPIEIKPGHNTIDVGEPGIYIIRVGDSVFKVRL